MPNPLNIIKFDQQYIDLLDQIADAGGELTDETEKALDHLAKRQTEKHENYILAMEHFKATVESFKVIETTFKKRRLSLEKEIDRWKMAMLGHLDNMETKLIETELGKIRGMGIKVIESDPWPEQVDPKYVTVNVTFVGKGFEEIKSFLDAQGFEWRSEGAKVDKKALLDDLKIDFDSLPLNEQKRLEDEMWKGERYSSDKVPGVAMTISRFPRYWLGTATKPKI